MMQAHDKPLSATRRRLPIAVQVVLALAFTGGAAAYMGGLSYVESFFEKKQVVAPAAAAVDPNTPRAAPGTFRPTPAQQKTLTIQPIEAIPFRRELRTEGKIAVNEDRTTPIFSPFSGRVLRILAEPGTRIERNDPLMFVETQDMVQAQNDLLGAVSALNKARSQLNLSEIIERRQRELFEGRAIALRDLQQARHDLVVAQSEVASAEFNLDMVRNRLRILGRTEDEIRALQQNRAIGSETPIYSPIAGTIVQRKVGPGQFVQAGSTDPMFMVSDLSSLWLVAQVRETDTAALRRRQAIEFRVLAFPERMFRARINFIAAAVDPVTRRLLVRAEIDNAEGLLRPEMFANVRIITSGEETSPAVPREAVIYEGADARVWVARNDGSLELRRIRTGLVTDTAVQVIDGVHTGERVVTRGALFIDRVASQAAGG